MYGYNIAQARAEELSRDYAVFLSPASGFWVCTDGLALTGSTYYRIYRTGDTVHPIPTDAFPWTLVEEA